MTVQAENTSGKKGVTVGKVLMACVFGVVLLGLAAAELFISAGSSAKGIWQTTNSAGAATKSDASGQTSGPEIESVRNGVLKAYNTTTIGKAFEGAFQNPKWRFFETAKGQKVVEFTGTGKAAALTGSGFRTAPNYKQSAAGFIEPCLEKLGLVSQQAGYSADKLSTYSPDALEVKAAEMYSSQAQRTEEDQHYINEVAIRKCIAAEVDIPVRFQFLLSADGSNGFQIGYFDEAPFQPFENTGADLGTILNFIYR